MTKQGDSVYQRVIKFQLLCSNCGVPIEMAKGTETGWGHVWGSDETLHDKAIQCWDVIGGGPKP